MGAFTLEIIGLLVEGGKRNVCLGVSVQVCVSLSVLSTLWTCLWACVYMIGACLYGLRLSQKNALWEKGAALHTRTYTHTQIIPGLDVYRQIRVYTQRLQWFTLRVTGVYFVCVCVFGVGVLLNDDNIKNEEEEGGGEVTRESLPFYECALLLEVMVACLLLWGMGRPLSKRGGGGSVHPHAHTHIRTHAEEKKGESGEKEELREPLLVNGGKDKERKKEDAEESRGEAAVRAIME